MDEKRKHKRRHLIYYLRVFDRSSDQLLGHLVDITHDGALLISEDPISPEELFQLRMALPEEIDDKEFLDFNGVSIWCKRDVNPDFFVTGFRFINLSEHDITTVARLIEDFGFSD